jgi:hypothetical protein
MGKFQQKELYIRLKINSKYNIYMFANRDNSHFASVKFSRKKGVVCKQDGGGYGVTKDSLTQSANSKLGASRPTLVKYDHCGGVKNPANLGVATIRSQTGGKRRKKQKGGNISHAYTRFNNSSTPSYGYTKQGAALASTLKGSYPAYTELTHSNQCGGRRKSRGRKSRGRKSRGKKSRRKKSRGRKSRGRKSRGRKSRRKKSRGRKSRRRKSRRRKSRRKKSRRKKSRRKKQRGGNYSTPNPSSMPWATGPGSFKKTTQDCKDNYNHYQK